jgi:hypothetical protein
MITGLEKIYMLILKNPEILSTFTDHRATNGEDRCAADLKAGDGPWGIAL